MNDSQQIQNARSIEARETGEIVGPFETIEEARNYLRDSYDRPESYSWEFIGSDGSRVSIEASAPADPEIEEGFRVEFIRAHLPQTSDNFESAGDFFGGIVSALDRVQSFGSLDVGRYSEWFAMLEAGSIVSGRVGMTAIRVRPIHRAGSIILDAGSGEIIEDRSKL